ncbi:MAG: hypothetical protein Unbinned5434contig1000_26 [Prokaryotic dsDNA virus sp.]|jgi:HK97 gp10 family phage protein|nr:MAG: hypothetical protein Unbinned5434contig1000_26 [Prokaryotic dsDNA virus sp.]|tara:strand:+ start:7229 stop:7675 length:447 start_codon:yes stop_codon:yes gene_type:complete
MNAKLKIDPSDLSKLKNKLDKLRRFESQSVSNELGKTGLEIVRIAKRSAPVAKEKGGTLRQSINSKKVGKSIQVEANANYAAYVEFGTGGNVTLDDMIALGIPSSYAKQFKGSKPGNMKAQPFFFGSARIGFKNLLNRLNDEMKKAIK